MAEFTEVPAGSTTNDLRQRPHVEIVIATHPTDPEAAEISVQAEHGPRADLVIDALLGIVDELRRRALRGEFL